MFADIRPPFTVVGLLLLPPSHHVPSLLLQSSPSRRRILTSQLTFTPAETFFQRISGIILFLDSSAPLPSVSDQNTYYLSKWFKKNSLVFVSGDHPIWTDNGGTKKPGKRFGAVRKSEVEGGVNDMLEKHREEIVEFVGARMGNGRGR